MQALGTALLLCAAAPAQADARFYAGVGLGVVHTGGPALQIAAPVYDELEIHYSRWNDAQRNSAVGIGYRFDNGSPVSVALGFAYVEAVSENLLRHAGAYAEVRVGPFGNFSCQVGHYSGVGDDSGENFLLCGVSWGGRR